MFVDDLVSISIDTTFLHTMGRCQWNPKALSITAPEDAKHEEDQALENTAWYRDEFGEHMKGKDKKNKQREYAAPEVLCGINDKHIYNGIHGDKGKGYAGNPGVAQLDLG